MICDGAVRSGKTFCMSLSFVLWAFYAFNGNDFGLCGKTIRSLRRNMVTPVIPLLRQLGFECEERLSQNSLTVRFGNAQNRFYYFGGKDESSAALIQGVTLSERVKRRYENLYTGAFYDRFVRGKWVAVYGAVYPMMANESMYCKPPGGTMEEYCVSCDYGTVNPTSMGLWGKKDGVWYRLDEYYFDSRREGYQKTDEEHYAALKTLAGGRKIGRVIVDPSAASFIEVIKRHGEYRVTPARNNVADGIRRVSGALKEGRIRICENCHDARREFQLYRWDSRRCDDSPVKENDHAMDDIRYFVATIDQGGGFTVFAAER